MYTWRQQALDLTVCNSKSSVVDREIRGILLPLAITAHIYTYANDATRRTVRSAKHRTEGSRHYWHSGLVQSCGFMPGSVESGGGEMKTPVKRVKQSVNNRLQLNNRFWWRMSRACHSIRNTGVADSSTTQSNRIIRSFQRGRKSPHFIVDVFCDSQHNKLVQ